MGLITQGSNNSNGLQHTSGGGTSTSTNLNTGVDSLGNNVGSLLSPRGTITQDDRTNTLIINDTAQSIDQIRKMIDLLDVQVKQVMVEARIVRASTSFTKELGVKWVFCRKVLPITTICWLAVVKQLYGIYANLKR